ncbi:SRPBCC family protein [Streptomyces winkii]|uniref:SRPBCC family protein n=1 Tax=Streptomyces winkii TaxID=3051178 RepID=UPI0028D21D3C|nr:SRPBCC domain-containing protein [Streptomyces sp. DSM 40971]
MSNNFEIRKEVVLEATPEQVWQAIATPEGQAGWSPDPYTSLEGVRVERESPTRLSVRTPEAPNGAFHAFEYVLEAREGGTTVLRFVHSGFLGDDWDAEFSFEEMTRRGWDMYLHTLAQYVKYFPGRPATYVEAEAPPATSAEESWPALQRALGLTGPVGVGEPVKLSPEGLPAIEGVVDYVEPGGDLLAVRTSDGLYRFHNRADMGMPIAVGHYLYAPTDRESTQKAWKSWLDGLFA